MQSKQVNIHRHIATAGNNRDKHNQKNLESIVHRKIKCREKKEKTDRSSVWI